MEHVPLPVTSFFIMALKASKKNPPKKSAVIPASGGDSIEPSGNTPGVADGLPDALAIEQGMERVRAIFAESRYATLVGFMQKLVPGPPAVLLLEGGTADLRLDVARLWSAWLNCPRSVQSFDNGQVSLLGSDTATCPARPCLECSHCVRMVMHMHRDCFYLDGLAESIKIGTVRDSVRPCLGEPPREARYRLVIFREAQTMTPDAANLMLKSLEEPVSATSFVLTAPQRERLLPTLVSRSMVLTLPWSTAASAPAQPDVFLVYEAALCRFLQNGQGLFQLTAQRGALDAHNAQALINHCRKALVLALGKGIHDQALPPANHATCPAGLWEILGAASLQRQRQMDALLAKAQEYVLAGVNPAATVEWALTKLYFLVR